MNALYANIVNELEKLYYRKKHLAFVILTALLPIITALAFSRLQQATGFFFVSESTFPNIGADFYAFLLFPLIIFSMTANCFSDEYKDHTIRLSLVRPISRLKLYLSKNIAMLLFIYLCIIVGFIASTGSSVFILQASYSPDILLAWSSAFADIAIKMTLIILAASFLSQFFNNGNSAFIFGLIFYFIIKALPFLYPIFSTISPFAFANKLTITAYSLIFFAVGYFMFDSKDF